MDNQLENNSPKFIKLSENTYRCRRNLLATSVSIITFYYVVDIEKIKTINGFVISGKQNFYIILLIITSYLTIHFIICLYADKIDKITLGMTIHPSDANILGSTDKEKVNPTIHKILMCDYAFERIKTLNKDNTTELAKRLEEYMQYIKKYRIFNCTIHAIFEIYLPVALGLYSICILATLLIP